MLRENGIRIAAMCCLTVAGAAWRCSVSIVQLDKSRDAVSPIALNRQSNRRDYLTGLTR
jgi:hypothetical protein